MRATEAEEGAAIAAERRGRVFCVYGCHFGDLRARDCHGRCVKKREVEQEREMRRWQLFTLSTDPRRLGGVTQPLSRLVHATPVDRLSYLRRLMLALVQNNRPRELRAVFRLPKQKLCSPILSWLEIIATETIPAYNVLPKDSMTMCKDLLEPDPAGRTSFAHEQPRRRPAFSFSANRPFLFIK